MPRGTVPPPPTAPPPTPFQPGAPPQPPLPIPGALGALGGLLLGELWRLLNGRPKDNERDLDDGDVIPLSPAGDVSVNFRYYARLSYSPLTRCSDGVSFPPAESEIQGPNSTGFFAAKAVRFGPQTTTFSRICGGSGNTPSTTVDVLTAIRANGDETPRVQVGDGGITAGASSSLTTTVTNIRWQRLNSDGEWEDQKIKEPRAFPPGIEPQRPLPLPPVPQPQPRPATPPQPEPQPLPAPAVPLPAPAPQPGGLPGPAPRPAPGVRPVPVPLPSTPGAPAPGGGGAITATGAPPAPARPPRVTAPGSTFLPGGQELPANGPPATPQGMANELGKLERKLEIALAPDGPLSLLELLNKVIDQVENIEFLIERLFPPGPYKFPAGQYELSPVCDRDSEGDLLPARVAPWAAGEGEFTELRRRLDALAQLLQHHKDLKQPTCGGRGNGPGSNVTVHFESD